MRNGRRDNFGEGARADYFRTDLACESAADARQVAEERVEVGATPVTVTRRRGEGGAASVTLECGRITVRSAEELDALGALVARELEGMAEAMTGREVGAGMRVLAVGLGNGAMTPDAVGPNTLRRVTATRHLRGYDETLFAALGCCELAALTPGVMGQTGFETGELVRAAVELVRPHLVVAVDALAARSCDRLASTIQLSDGGISPGAGIGNHRMALTEATMGCPVMGVGVPTVVDSSTLVLDALEQAGLVTAEAPLPEPLVDVLERGRSFIVTPRDCDEMVSMTCQLLARGLNEAFGVAD